MGVQQTPISSERSRRQVKAQGGPRATSPGRPGRAMRGHLHHPPPDRRRCSCCVVVSMVTFAIFFLVPRLAGRPRRPRVALRRQTARRGDDRTRITAKLGFTTRSSCSTAGSLQGIFVGADYNSGPTTEHCPAPCFGYSFITQQPGLPDLLDRLPVTLSLAARRRGDLAGQRGRASASSPRCAGAASSTGRRWASRWPACRCRSSSPACLRCRSSATGSASPRPAGSYTPITENPRMWAYDLILPWITLAFLYAAVYARLTRAGMLETMGEDYIRTARAKGLQERTVVVKHGLRAALTPILTIFGLDLGLLLGGAILTESTFSLPGIGKFVDRRHQRQRPAAGPGRDPVRGVLHRPGEPDRGPPLRGGRPEGEAVMTRRSLETDEPALPRTARPADPLPDRRRPGQVRRRAVLHARARQDAGHRGRVGLRQERDQPRHPGPAQRQRREISGEIWLGRRGARQRRPGPRARAARQARWR